VEAQTAANTQKYGFQTGQNDPASFTSPTTKVAVFIWVDDFVTVSNTEQTESYDKSILEQFEGRYLGDASWILGREVLRDRRKRTITITQLRMTKTLLDSSL
jgi:hypothetical protein